MTIDDTTQGGAAPLPPSVPTVPAAMGFRDPSKITRILTTILWASLALDCIAVLSGLLEYHLLQEMQSGAITGSDMNTAANADDSRQRLIGIGQVATYVVTVIVFGRWIYVLNANKIPLGASGLQFTPGWAVGWFFIPFANLWKPYQAMKELWLVSADPLHWQQQERGQLLPWWWFLWLLANILGQMSFRLSLHATDMSDFVAANVVSDLADSTSIALEIVAILLVGQITRMQLARRPAGGP